MLCNEIEAMHDFAPNLRAEIIHSLVFVAKNHAQPRNCYRRILKIMHSVANDAAEIESACS